MIIGYFSQPRPVIWQIEQCLIVDTPLNSALLFIIEGSYTCQIISKMGRIFSRNILCYLWLSFCIFTFYEGRWRVEKIKDIIQPIAMVAEEVD
jgi:hypothetical protein